jgi:hypothetical protein
MFETNTASTVTESTLTPTSTNTTLPPLSNDIVIGEQVKSKDMPWIAIGEQVKSKDRPWIAMGKSIAIGVETTATSNNSIGFGSLTNSVSYNTSAPQPSSSITLGPQPSSSITLGPTSYTTGSSSCNTSVGYIDLNSHPKKSYDTTLMLKLQKLTMRKESDLTDLLETLHKNEVLTYQDLLLIEPSYIKNLLEEIKSCALHNAVKIIWEKGHKKYIAKVMQESDDDDDAEGHEAVQGLATGGDNVQGLATVEDNVQGLATDGDKAVIKEDKSIANEIEDLRTGRCRQCNLPDCDFKDRFSGCSWHRDCFSTHGCFSCRLHIDDTERPCAIFTGEVAYHGCCYNPSLNLYQTRIRDPLSSLSVTGPETKTITISSLDN